MLLPPFCIRATEHTQKELARSSCAVTPLRCTRNLVYRSLALKSSGRSMALSRPRMPSITVPLVSAMVLATESACGVARVGGSWAAAGKGGAAVGKPGTDTAGGA